MSKLQENLKVRFNDTDRYLFLSRMQVDCVNYLNEDNKQTFKESKYLAMGNVKDQIEEMKALYNEVSVKPVWCTLEDIKHYEEEMNKIAFE